MNHWRLPVWGALVAAAFLGCGKPPAGGEAKDGKGSEKKPTLAYVTNGIASFWVIADKGAKKAGQDLGVNVEVRMPPDGIGDQKRMVQELLTKGVDGIAISPINPDNQRDLLNEIAANTILITHDSDAPESKRVCYVGMNNYDGGRMCGELVKKAMPEGGSVMLFVGRLDQLNAQLRRQGTIDELLGRSKDPTRRDPPGAEIKGEKYTVLDTRTDQFDFQQAKSQAQNAIAKYPDLGCMVGLFAYNPPLCLEAVREAGKLGKIKVVAFDEDEKTLKGIEAGEIYGSVVQNPFRYGYESIRILNGLAKKDNSVLPKDNFLDIPARAITKDNVKAFSEELDKLTK